MSVTPRLECLQYRIEEQCLHYGRFSIGPIQRGQGITVGNALRRVLVSELSGVAITSIEFLNFDSIIHEFSTLPGVRESVFELLLSLKDIVISKVDSQRVLEPQKCLLSLRGPGVVKANAIQLPDMLQLVDPNQSIATLYSENVFFDLELTIQEGQGLYVFPKDKRTDIQSIPVESTFVPVKKVHYIVEDYEVGNSEMERCERIMLEVWTNGSIYPIEAIHQGTKVLMDLFTPLLELKEPQEDKLPFVLPYSQPTNQTNQTIQTAQTIPATLQSNLMSPKNVSVETLPFLTNPILIEDLGLSVRSYNCLKSAHIHTVSDLLDYSKENLLEIKNFGKKSAEEVVEALQNRLGIELPN
jgi:DNA-directed RNA polymerase subunit alpha|tara:strand:+ start:387 stop:1454 length:1068 start_codon:yes stop_codon:yes gene_type:complete